MIALFSSSDAAIILAALITFGGSLVVLAIGTFRRSGDTRDAAHETRAQMNNNGGSSLRDAVDRIERQALRFERKWDDRFNDLDKRVDRIETAATKAAEKAEVVATNLAEKDTP